MLRIIYTLLFSILLFSCKKSYLDRTINDYIAKDEVFSNITNADMFLSMAYMKLPTFFKPGGDANWALSSGTDESEQIWDNGLDANYFNTGNWGPSLFPLQQFWSTYYQTIRRLNIFITNYDLIPEDASDPARKKRLLGEAYALRAFFYFELYKQWGGVPIITEALNVTDPDMNTIKRSTAEEVINQIKSDIEKAIPNLPAIATGSYFGRANAVMCKHLLSRALLYYASALTNINNDKSRWQDAATAAQDAITSALAAGVKLSQDAWNGKRAYESIFLNAQNPEIIFARQGQRDWWDQVTCSNAENGWYGTGPTVEMMNAYEMNSGLAISDPASSYDPQNPAQNRDPRFYQTILVHGQTWKGRVINVKGPSTPVGLDFKTDHPATSIFLRKFMEEDGSLITRQGFYYRPWVLMRLSELYLNYAEAQNEAVGPDASVYEAINKIRSRNSVNMPALPAGLSQQQMRDRIRNERRIELAFEEHRFWDVRRWKIAETVDNGSIRKMEVDQNGVITYPVLEPRIFLPKHYLFPIPQDEMDRNTKLVQNPGW